MILQLNTSIHSLEIWLFSLKKILHIYHHYLVNWVPIALSGRKTQYHFPCFLERLTAEDKTDFKMAKEYELFQAWDAKIQGLFFQKCTFWEWGFKGQLRCDQNEMWQWRDDKKRVEFHFP